jgi:HSP20 family protein
MAQKQNEKQGTAGKQQELVRQAEQPVARRIPSQRRIARTSPISTIRRMLDGLDAGMFGWSPGSASMMRRMFDDMERMFETDFFEEVERPAREYVWAPRVEVRQRDDKLVICVDLPGVSQDQIAISAQDTSLVIEGERAMPAETGDLWQSERAYGRFRRSVSLPEGVDVDQVSARFENGVLEITLPLPASQTSRRIQIGSGGQATQPQAEGAQAAGTQAQGGPQAQGGTQSQGGSQTQGGAQAGTQSQTKPAENRVETP